MLICQPPVKIMQVTLDCCGNERYLEPMSKAPRYWATNVDQRPHSEQEYREADQDKHLDDESIENNNVVKSLEIKSKTGITIGDVYDASLAIRSAHALVLTLPLTCTMTMVRCVLKSASTPLSRSRMMIPTSRRKLWRTKK